MLFCLPQTSFRESGHSRADPESSSFLRWPRIKKYILNPNIPPGHSVLAVILLITVRRLPFILLIISWLAIDIGGSITSDRFLIGSPATEKLEEAESRVEEVQWIENRKAATPVTRVKRKPWGSLPVFYLPSKKENFAFNQSRPILYRSLLI